MFTKPINGKTTFLESEVTSDAPFLLAYALKESLDDGIFVNECFDVGDDYSVGMVELGAFNYALYVVDDENTHIFQAGVNGEKYAKAVIAEIIKDIARDKSVWNEYYSNLDDFFEDFSEYYPRKENLS